MPPPDDSYDDTDDGIHGPDEQDADDDPAESPCPYCNREISEEAVRCPHCGCYLSAEDAPRSRPWWWIVAVIILVLLLLKYALRW